MEIRLSEEMQETRVWLQRKALQHRQVWTIMGARAARVGTSNNSPQENTLKTADLWVCIDGEGAAISQRAPFAALYSSNDRCIYCQLQMRNSIVVEVKQAIGQIRLANKSKELKTVSHL